MGAVHGCQHRGQAGAAQGRQELTCPSHPWPLAVGGAGRTPSLLDPEPHTQSGRRWFLAALQVACALASSSGHWWMAGGCSVPGWGGAGTRQDRRREREASCIPALVGVEACAVLD